MTTKPPFVLVHGAWHGAWTWERVIPHLVRAGHRVIARDLPGHGLNARYPSGYHLGGEAHLGAEERRARLAEEPSPSAALTLQDHAEAVVDMLDMAGVGGAIVVAHSFGGLPVTQAAEMAAAKILGLVYLSAFMPSPGLSGLEYVTSAENEGELVVPALVADPKQIGALRFDLLSRDGRKNVQRAFYGSAQEHDAEAMCSLLTPDLATAPFVTPVSTGTEIWGALPRHYIRCARDRAIMPRLQQRFIDEADAISVHRTVVHDLDTDHSPFLCKPAELADCLLRIAEVLPQSKRAA
jgi:pimeloyl-ACP methyl ester carboxylesterase